MNILAIVALNIIILSSAEGSFRYVLQPMDMSFMGTSYTQYFHMYVTASSDTQVDVTVPGSVEYSKCVHLSSDNSWSWREQLVLSGTLLSESLEHGFRLTSTEPINAYVVRYILYNYEYLSAYVALPVTQDSTSVMIGTYLRRYSTNGYEQLFVISAWDVPTEYRVYDYSSSGNPSLVLSGTLAPYDSVLYETYSSEYVGYEINTTSPVSVFAGNMRVPIPFDSSYYSSSYPQYTKPLFQQVPPLSSHAQLYVIGPIPTAVRYTPYFSVFITFPVSYIVFTVRYRPDVSITITIKKYSHTCSISTQSGYSTITCTSTPKGGYLEIQNSKSQYPIVLECSKRCYPMLLKHTDTSGNQLPGGYMSLSAPPAVVPLPMRFSIPNCAVPNSIDDTYVVIALQGNNSGVILDGVKVDVINQCVVDVVTSWTVLSCHVAPGVHLIDHVSGDIMMAIHVHGYTLKTDCSTCYSNSYGYPVYYPVSSGEPTIPSPTTAATTTTAVTTETDTTSLPAITTAPIEQVPSDVPVMDIIHIVLEAIIIAGVVTILVFMFIYRKHLTTRKAPSSQFVNPGYVQNDMHSIIKGSNKPTTSLQAEQGYIDISGEAQGDNASSSNGVLAETLYININKGVKQRELPPVPMEYTQLRY